MSFRTYEPCAELRPFIRSFAISEEDEVTEYAVYPGTSLVMGFQYRGQLGYVNEGIEMPLAPAGITGLMDTLRIFRNSPGIGTVLVFFTETGASAFFRTPLHLLFGESLPLDDLIPAGERDMIREKLDYAVNDKERVDVIEKFLSDRIGCEKSDTLVSAAVSLVILSKGRMSIRDVAEKVCISQGRLEKRFRAIVGATPKKFASIVRFRYILEQAGSAPDLTQLALDSGYFDQAHFIHDFRSFTGISPGNFLKK